MTPAQTCQPGCNRCVRSPRQNPIRKLCQIGWETPVRPEAEAAPEEDVPDWLRSLRGESSREAEPLTDSGDAEIEPAQQDVPDWLSGMRDTSSEELEEHEASEEPAAQFGEAEQEWLGRIDSPLAPEIASPARRGVHPFEERKPG